MYYSYKEICLSVHYNGEKSYLLVNGTEIIIFKEKDSKIVATQVWLGSILKDFSVDNMKETGLYGYVYDVSVDDDVIVVTNILDIQKHLMKKNVIV